MDFIHIILFFPNNRWKLKLFFLMTDMVLDKNLLRWGERSIFFIVKSLLKAYLKNILKKKYLYRLSIFHSNFVFHLVLRLSPLAYNKRKVVDCFRKPLSLFT